MNRPLDSVAQGQLAASARMYRPDAQLDGAADLYENDRQAFQQLPARLQDLGFMHYEMRRTYRDAVRAGVIAPDRGPSAA